MSNYQTLRSFGQSVVVVLSIVVTAACSPPSTSDDTDIPSGTAKLFAKLKSMDGKSGTFEGIYQPLNEGAAFHFCTKDECPDVKQLYCNPEFSTQAASALHKIWSDHDGEKIYVIASGTIHTGAKTGRMEGYGHLNHDVCEIEISRVQQARIVKTTLVRSKRFPLLTTPP